MSQMNKKVRNKYGADFGMALAAQNQSLERNSNGS